MTHGDTLLQSKASTARSRAQCQRDWVLALPVQALSDDVVGFISYEIPFCSPSSPSIKPVLITFLKIFKRTITDEYPGTHLSPLTFPTFYHSICPLKGRYNIQCYNDLSVVRLASSYYLSIRSGSIEIMIKNDEDLENIQEFPSADNRSNGRAQLNLELEMIMYMPPAGFKQNFSWKYLFAVPMGLR